MPPMMGMSPPTDRAHLCREGVATGTGCHVYEGEEDEALARGQTGIGDTSIAHTILLVT